MNRGLEKIWNLIEFLADLFFVKIFHIKFSEKQWNTFMQFLKFGLVGVTNTVISYTIYVVCLWGCNEVGIENEYDYIFSQVIAFLLGVLWSFYWNNKMVFRVESGQKRNVWKALLKTYVSYSFTGLFLNTLLLFLWIKIIGISEYIAPIINLLISVPLNFIINKLWAFKSKEE